MDFHIKMIGVLKGSQSSRYNLREVSMDAQSMDFPSTLLLPILSELSIEDLNKLISNNIWPLGLVSEATMADGDLLTPYGFFMHDHFHYRRFLEHAALHSNKVNESYLGALQSTKHSASDLRHLAFWYFILAHEYPEKIAEHSRAQAVLLAHSRIQNIGDLPSNLVKDLEGADTESTLASYRFSYEKSCELLGLSKLAAEQAA